MDVWHDPVTPSAPPELVLPAPPAEQDTILLDRIAPLVAAGTHSFLRAIKPDWRLEVTRHAPPVRGAACDAIADSVFVLELIRLERAGRAGRTRREVLLASIAAATEGLGRAERLDLHRDGFAWAIDNGRWDAIARRGLERRFLALAAGLADVASRAPGGSPDAWGGAEVAAAAMTRWQVPARHGEDPGGEARGIRRRIAHHANRLAVFAEPEAILHYFCYRLSGGAPVADLDEAGGGE